MTRSTIARIIRYGQRSGSLPAGTSPVGMAAYVRGFLNGVRRRAAGKERSWVAPEYRDDPKYAAFVRQVARFRGEA